MDFTVERIQELINMNNESAAPLMKKLGMSSTEAIIKIAKYFNVSTDYLLLENEIQDNNFLISKEEQEWLDLYKQLSHADSHIKDECIGFVKGYIERGNQK